VRTHLFGAAAAIVAALALAPVASAIDNVNSNQLRKGVTVAGILEHERALQDVAIANDGTRFATSPGYLASLDYVEDRLKRAGYTTERVPFDFPKWTLNAPSTVEETAPTARTFAEDADYIVAQFSAGADVTGNVVPTNDIQIPPPGGAGSGTSGCEASDFPPETTGNIALMQRGTCTFVDKYDNAKAAGAIGAVIFNDGFEDREAPIATTSTANIGIPTLMIGNDIGESLYGEAQSGPVTMHIAVDATTTPNTEYDLVADTPSGNPDRTIVVGAHLDSVEVGPGINDNGSGTATILDIAERMAELNQKPRNRVRFAFWGAEEAGLVGSTAYVKQLVANGQIGQIEANLNFDMVGSPNFVRFVYDGDNSTGEGSVGPAGSGEIEAMFNRYFRQHGLATDPTPFDGRSDYGEFILNGVPAGGLFTGAEGIKTEQQEAVYGGVAGLAYDPCYHQACDTFFNLNTTALDQMSDAAAHATWTLARSQSPITQAETAKAAGKGKAKKAAKRTKALRYRADLRVR
jgi:Zn-dependent M28 family amino/carboxypeptidase